MNAQAKKEENPKDASLFQQFQLRTAGKDFSKFKTGTAETERLELAGVRRIMIELEGKPEMKEFCRRYANLVDSIAYILKDDLKPYKDDEFIIGIWGIMQSNFDIKYGTSRAGFLWESLQTKKLDCDNVSFLVFDVAKTLGINAKIVSVPDHTFIATDNFYCGTGRVDWGKIRPIDKLKSQFSIIYTMTSDVEVIQYLSYGNRGVAHRKEGLRKEAISDFTKAIELNPKDADIYHNRGLTYLRVGRIDKAARDFITARKLEIAPLFDYLKEELEKVWRKIH